MENVLNFFKVIVLDDNQKTTKKYNTDNCLQGYITNFTPTKVQQDLLAEVFEPLDIKTLYSVEERNNSNLFELISKQIYHYVEVYGLNTPGLFNLEVEGGKLKVPLTFVKGVTKKELRDLVLKLIYAPNPIKNTAVLKQIIEEYNIDYDINLILNNEMKVMLFNLYKDTFKNGDDAVRYICYAVTEDPLLIKSKEMLNTIVNANKMHQVTLDKFLEKHVIPLSQVFNRHKQILLALKNERTKTVINKIARLSKKNHVPIKEAINKTFVNKSLNNQISLKDIKKILDDSDLISLRDKFKYLNLLEYKKEQRDSDAFIIRNGKVHVEYKRNVYEQSDIDNLIDKILESLKKDLKHLKNKNILLDSNVDYGLPVSRKQTMGNLPFGTSVSVNGDEISSGIYWHNDGGAYDLDLSAIDPEGNRTGWGMYSAYDKSNPIFFSGDLTDARNGAMEFTTSDKYYPKPYGLFVNIFRGAIGSKAEIVVGNKTSKQWIETPILKEKIELQSAGNIIGFIRNGKFVVWNLRTSKQIVSNDKSKNLLARGNSDFWTVQKLFDRLKIKYDVKKNKKTNYDFDMQYSNFSLDKLEKMLYH